MNEPIGPAGGPEPAMSTQAYLAEPLNERRLEQIRAAGFKMIEIWGMAPHFDCASDAAVRLAKEAAASQGLEVHSLHAPYFVPKGDGKASWLSIAHPNPSRRGESVRHILTALDALEALGGRFLVVHFGSTSDRPSPDVLGALRESLLELSAAAHGRPVRIALENVGAHLASTARIVETLEEIGLDDLGVCLDVGHAHLWEEADRAILRCAGRIFTMHVHDNGGVTDDHWLPFEGTLPWESAAAGLAEAGYAGALVMEPKARESLESPARQSMEAVRRFLDMVARASGPAAVA